MLGMRLRLCVLGALLVGCAREYTLPDRGPTDFAVGGDAELAALVRDGAAEWARSGLELAAFVTVDDAAGGFAVRRVPRSELGAVCYYTAARSAAADVHSFDGCTMFFSTERNRRGVFVADDLSPERLAVVIKHEMVHVLLPSAPHVAGAAAAVFSENATSAHVTDADLDHLAAYAEVETR